MSAADAPPAAARRRSLSSNVFSRIIARETSTADASRGEFKAFACIPPRLTLPVERIVDDARAMLRCVLLGFTADGDHLVSYSASGESGYALQIWRFRVGARATLLATTPLFDADERALRWDENDGFDGGDGIRVCVCESWDRSTLVIHGEERRLEGSEDGASTSASGEVRRAKRCFVTVLPSPASVKPGTAIAATHMSYLSAAHSPFHASWSGIVPPAKPSERELDERSAEVCGNNHESNIESGDPYAFNELSPVRRKRKLVEVARDLIDCGHFGLNTSDALLCVDVATATLNPRDAHDRSLMEAQVEGKVSGLVSVVPACHSPLVKWHGNEMSDVSVGEDDLFVDAAELGDATPYVFVSALPNRVRVCVLTPWIALEMDKLLNHSLRAALDFGFVVRDYELLPLQYQASAKEGEDPSMLVACLSVLAPSSWAYQPSCPGRMRIVVTIIDRPLDRTLGDGTIVYSHELPVSVDGKQPTPVLLHTARAHVMMVRKSIIIPTSRWIRNASSMANTNVVTSGESAVTIKHPTLPICIIGYGIRLQRIRA